MKIRCGRWRRKLVEEAKAAYEEKQKWHPFFTVRPRKIGTEDCRWLEWIERRVVPEHRKETDKAAIKRHTEGQAKALEDSLYAQFTYYSRLRSYATREIIIPETWEYRERKD